MHRTLLALALAACTFTTATGLPIYDIQHTTDPSGDSPYAGQVVTTGGVVTAVHYDGFVMNEGAGPWQSLPWPRQSRSSVRRTDPRTSLWDSLDSSR